ncbi:hypothetical protein BC629DRAFT_489836 [Irpex lacteus]|nr:hypothetical protein BC629DRAFT_489836 [Irpex lacteus]
MGVQLPLGEPGKRQARIIYEVDTTEDMCDTSGNLSSGCIASIVDWSTSIACRLLVLYLDPGLPLHVSLSLGVTNHTPAPLGCRLQIVSTTVSFNTQTADSKTEIFDKTHGRRIASGWHTKMVPSVVKL